MVPRIVDDPDDQDDGWRMAEEPIRQTEIKENKYICLLVRTECGLSKMSRLLLTGGRCSATTKSFSYISSVGHTIRISPCLSFSLEPITCRKTLIQHFLNDKRFSGYVEACLG